MGKIAPNMQLYEGRSMSTCSENRQRHNGAPLPSLVVGLTLMTAWTTTSETDVPHGLFEI
jgi:hypothetical protein